MTKRKEPHIKRARSYINLHGSNNKWDKGVRWGFVAGIYLIDDVD